MAALQMGYAVVDAMVALLIIAATVTLSLHALYQARRLANAAEEIREANVLLGELLDDGLRTLNPIEGATGVFAWTVEMQPSGAERPVAVCRRVVTLKAIRTARSYVRSTYEACPPDTSV